MLQLDVYNQRILEKREQQYQDLLARKKAEKNRDCTMIPPGISTLAQLRRKPDADFLTEVSPKQVLTFYRCMTTVIF